MSFQIPEFLLKSRKMIVARLGAKQRDLNLRFWDLGDEWFDWETGIEIDVVYWEKSWIENKINLILQEYQANLGYTTCFWHTILNSKCLFDHSGWFTAFQNTCRIPYPQKLRNAIIDKNYPVLRNVIASYYNQIKKAIARNDLIAVNHRIAAFIASYFDILFAVNYMTHPGEKKVLNYFMEKCSKQPKELQNNINEILGTTVNEFELLPGRLNVLLDYLDESLIFIM